MMSAMVTGPPFVVVMLGKELNAQPRGQLKRSVNCSASADCYALQKLSPLLCLSFLLRVFLEQLRKFFLRWELTEAMLCTSNSPLQLLICVGFYEWLVGSSVL